MVTEECSACSLFRVKRKEACPRVQHLKTRSPWLPRPRDPESRCLVLGMVLLRISSTALGYVESVLIAVLLYTMYISHSRSEDINIGDRKLYN